MTNPNKAALVIAALIGGWHLCWSLLVLFGWAQPLLDFAFWAHMIPIYVIKPFDAVAAVTLLVISSVWGYIFGYAGRDRVEQTPPIASVAVIDPCCGGSAVGALRQTCRSDAPVL